MPRASALSDLPARTPALTPRVALVSAALSIAWDAGIVRVFGTPPYLSEFGSPVAGAIAGLACGWLTMRSRRKREGREDFLDSIASYYLAAAVYGMSLGAIWYVPWWWSHGGWTEIHLLLTQPSLVAWSSCVLATPFVVVLFPFWLLTRVAIWRLSGQRRSVDA